MKLKVVLGFVFLLVVIGFLGAFQFVNYGGLTGFVVFNGSGDSESLREGYFGDGFDFEITDYYRGGQELKVFYFLREHEGQHKEVGLDYGLLDLDGGLVVSGDQRVILSSGSEGEYVMSIELPKDSFGEYFLDVEVSSDREFFETRLDVFLSKRGNTGLVISESDKKNVSFFGIALFFVLGLAYVIRMLYRNSSVKKVACDLEEGLIRLNPDSYR